MSDQELNGVFCSCGGSYTGAHADSILCDLLGNDDGWINAWLENVDKEEAEDGVEDEVEYYSDDSDYGDYLVDSGYGDYLVNFANRVLHARAMRLTIPT